jgi:hypothetical protein
LINRGVVDQFDPFLDGMVRPVYDGYSFAVLPDTVHYLLTGEQRGPVLPADCFPPGFVRPRNVVLFLIDGFGWEGWSQGIGHSGYCADIASTGMLTPISALFPSTTAAAISTMNLGVTPARHALFEWHLYLEEYGEVIQTLPFTPPGTPVYDACKSRGHDPGQLLAEKETVYERLSAFGVDCVQFVHRNYATSSYNTLIGRGARVQPYATLAQALVGLRRALEEAEDQTYAYFYWADIDTIGHLNGPGSPEHLAEIESFWRTFATVMAGCSPPDTLFLFTADHGQLFSDPADTVYLNEALPEIASLLATGPDGAPIYPAGSPRDLFLHVRDGQVDEVCQLLEQTFGDYAHVLTTAEALEAGLFGEPPYAPEFLRRLGQVLLLPAPGRCIWWREEGKFSNRFRGHHGGLTPAELTTVVLTTSAL